MFDPDKLLNFAKQKTGETTFSSAPLMAPLGKLCAAIRTEARLSAFGRIIQATRLKTLIVNRLRLDALMRRHPEILEQPVPDIIVIVGLARTGTTLLHRSLAADPEARTLPSWETLNPAPLPNERGYSATKRIKQGESAAKFMDWLAPDFSAVHPLRAKEPEEDILLLDLTFLSQTAEAVMHVPSYSAWLETQDHLPAYEYLRDVLKTLAWMRPGNYWVLKTPNHSEQLGPLLSAFPNATIVQTHRDPMETMASCCSLMAHSQGLSSDHVDPYAIGKHWLRKVARMADFADKGRKANPAAHLVDIYYKDLISDPFSAISAIYQARGQAMSTERWHAVREAAKRPKPNAVKRHAYDLSDFGLTADDIDQTFGDYRAQYAIPRKGSQHD